MKKKEQVKTIRNFSNIYRHKFEVALQNLAVYEAEKRRIPLSEQLWNLRNT